MARGTLSGGLYRISIDGNTVTPIAVPADPADGAHAGYDTFAVSADGRWLAYAPRSPFNTLPQEPVHLFLQDLSSGSSPVDLGTFGQVGTVAVSSQGKVLISGSIDPVSEPSLLSGNAYLVDGGSVTPLPWMQDSYGASWSPDGTLVAAPASTGGDIQLKVGDVLGASVRTFTVMAQSPGRQTDCPSPWHRPPAPTLASTYWTFATAPSGISTTSRRIEHASRGRQMDRVLLSPQSTLPARSPRSQSQM